MHLQIHDNYDELFKWKTFDRLAFKWNLLRTPEKNNHVANKRPPDRQAYRHPKITYNTTIWHERKRGKEVNPLDSDVLKEFVHY